MIFLEQEQSGDGLFAEYYDNENFLGDGSKVIEKKIDFDWTGKTPYLNFGDDNFSAKFQGFIKVPVSGYYQFMADVDDGCALFLNEQLLINYNMRNQSFEKTNAVQYFSNSNKLETDEIFLVGGLKYEFKFLVYHSIHNKFYEDGVSYARLSWKSEHFPREIIKEENFYLGNRIPPLKISNYQVNKFKIRKINLSIKRKTNLF